MDDLSLNTMATLLLAAPLIVGRQRDSADILSPRELNDLEMRLRDLGREPADLLSTGADSILEECRHVMDEERAGRLLSRGFLLSQAVEHWRARSIWVISRTDELYPQPLMTRLKSHSPPLLYGCGNLDIVDDQGLAVIGSRNVNDALADYARNIGRLAAESGRTLVSGGARGIDQAAMRGALESGGRAIGVLSHDLIRSAMRREHRDLLIDERLLLLSPYDPGAGFDVGNAMRRNKLIYALAENALVVSADLEKGGTWQGATEQLKKLRPTPVYVRSTGESSKALEALKEKGALSWPNPDNLDELGPPGVALPGSTSPGVQAEMAFDLTS